MFIRKAKNKYGEVTKLVESYRNSEGRPRQRLVASLGCLKIPRQSWRDVGKAVEERLYETNQPLLLPPDRPPEVREWIDYIVGRIEREGRWRPIRNKLSGGACEDSGTSGKKKAGGTLDGVLIDELSHMHSTTLGPLLLGLHAWKALKMPELLQQLGFNQAQRDAAAALVINRIEDPVSEHALPAWLSRSSFPDLLGEDIVAGGDDRFYRVGDALLRLQDRIEAHIRDRQADIFGLDRTILLYDLTNTHFEGVCASNPKGKRGKNKQKRNDCPQVVVGMVFDQSGFELAHRTFQGNMNDSKSLVEMIDELNRVTDAAGLHDLSRKPLLVMDSGVATKANRRFLRRHGYSYLVNDSRPSRKKWVDHFSRAGFEAIPGRDGDRQVLVRLEDVETEEKFPGGETEIVSERLILCRSQGRCDKERAIRSKAEQRLLDDLGKLSSSVRNGNLKAHDKIQRKIGRIRQKHPRAGRYYDIEFEQPKDKAQCGIARWKRKDHQWETDEKMLGCYVLRTDRKDMAKEELWNLYMTLTRAEEGFKVLKSDLGMRPNYHQLEERVDTHIFVTVLAFQLLCYIRKMLESIGDNRQWDTIRQILRTHCYATIILPTSNGSARHIRKPGIPEACQHKIYDLFNINPGKLPIRKITVETKKPWKM